jgi:hypothetical protein
MQPQVLEDTALRVVRDREYQKILKLRERQEKLRLSAQEEKLLRKQASLTFHFQCWLMSSIATKFSNASYRTAATPDLG